MHIEHWTLNAHGVVDVPNLNLDWSWLLLLLVEWRELKLGFVQQLLLLHPQLVLLELLVSGRRVLALLNLRCREVFPMPSIPFWDVVLIDWYLLSLKSWQQWQHDPLGRTSLFKMVWWWLKNCIEPWGTKKNVIDLQHMTWSQRDLKAAASGLGSGL